MSKFIIAIDGFDCNGKETITNLLEKKFINAGYRVSKKSLPNYETRDFCIKVINGAFEKLPKDLIIESFLMHIASETHHLKDKNFKDNIEQSKDIEIQLFDRFWFCNLWYNCDKKKDLTNFTTKFKPLLDLLPKPDLSFIIKSKIEADLFFLKERRTEELSENPLYNEEDYEDIYENNIKGYIKRKSFFINNFDTIFNIVENYSVEAFNYNNFKPKTIVENENGGYSLVSELITLEEQAEKIFKTAMESINNTVTEKLVKEGDE